MTVQPSQGGARPQRVFHRKGEDVARDFHLEELYVVEGLLDKLTDQPKSRNWRGASGWCLTLGIGRALGFLFPAFDESAKYPGWLVPAYAIAVGVLLAAAVLCHFAAKGMDDERVTSLADVKEQLGHIFDRYEVGS